jgi:hypothetical protein
MKRRGFTTVADLADMLYLDRESDVLSWVCLPVAFRPAKSAKLKLDYYLALCDLEWNKGTQTYESTI